MTIPLIYGNKMNAILAEALDSKLHDGLTIDQGQYGDYVAMKVEEGWLVGILQYGPGEEDLGFHIEEGGDGIWFSEKDAKDIIVLASDRVSVVGSKTPTSIWEVAHGREFAVPKEIEDLVAELVLVDHSYKNDTCPRFAIQLTKPDAGYVSIWVEHPDPDKRESEDRDNRFAVCYAEAQGDETKEEFATNDVRTAIDKALKLAAKYCNKKAINAGG